MRRRGGNEPPSFVYFPLLLRHHRNKTGEKKKKEIYLKKKKVTCVRVVHVTWKGGMEIKKMGVSLLFFLFFSFRWNMKAPEGISVAPPALYTEKKVKESFFFLQ